MTPDLNDGITEPEYENEGQGPRSGQPLVRKGKLILYNRPPNPMLDETVVSVERYNCFGSNLHPNRSEGSPLVAGITSANAGEGKTVVAANLATFFALDSLDDTVLVDLNFNNPRIHNIFGVSVLPGIRDSLRTDTITLSRTAIKGLWVLPVGELKGSQMGFDIVLGLREVISTLREHFRFIILDLPSANDPAFPGLIGSHIDGFVVVVAAGKTKKTDVSQLVTFINENKIIGFVMNRVSQGMAKL